MLVILKLQINLVCIIDLDSIIGVKLVWNLIKNNVLKQSN